MKDDRLISLKEVLAEIDAMPPVKAEGHEFIEKTCLKTRLELLPSAANTNVGGNLVDGQEAISAICNACGKIDCDKMDKCDKLQLPPANNSEITNSSDTISRQELLNRTINNPLHPPYIMERDVLNCPSAQLESCEDAVFWRKRAEEYENQCIKLAAEIARNSKFDSVELNDKGIKFTMKQAEHRSLT